MPDLCTLMYLGLNVLGAFEGIEFQRRSEMWMSMHPTSPSGEEAIVVAFSGRASESVAACGERTQGERGVARSIHNVRHRTAKCEVINVTWRRIGGGRFQVEMNVYPRWSGAVAVYGTAELDPFRSFGFFFANLLNGTPIEYIQSGSATGMAAVRRKAGISVDYSRV